MANQYRATYQNTAGENFQIDLIPQFEAVTQTVAVNMKAIIERPSVDGPLAVVRPTTCTIEVEASTSQTFDDLFTETEEQWIIEVQQNGSEIFQGWLQPEGIFEDFVNDVWVLELQGTDGLANLANKAYVDSSGNNYEGLEGLGTILKNALDRTGFDTRDIKFIQRSASGTEFPVRYVEDFGTGAFQDWFNQVLDQGIFIDDDESPNDCLTVLENVLGAANAIVHYEAGAWYINWALQWANPSIAGAFQYSLYTGGAGSPSTVAENVNRTIYSQVNASGTDLFWIREDQRIERRPSMAVSRVEYRYRGVGPANANPNLNNDGASISGWSVSQPGAVTLISPDIVEVTVGTNPNTVALAGTEISTSFLAGTSVYLLAQWNNLFAGTLFHIANFELKARAAGTTYYLTGFATNPDTPPTWETTPGSLQFMYGPAVGDYQTTTLTGQKGYITPALPEDANLTVSIVDTSGAVLQFSYVQISNIIGTTSQGVQYTAQRISKTSSYKEDARKLIISAQENDIVYLGTLLQADQSSRIEEGYITTTSAFNFPLHQKMLVDRMMLRGKAVRVFTGSIYGYVPYNSRILIDGFTGKQFVFTSQTYDTGTGITRGTMFEVVWDTNDADDVTVERRDNAGEVVEPKIRG